MPLWGTAINTSIEILRRYQNKVLRATVNIPLYISNKAIHADLTLSNPVFLPIAYSPALIHFGQEGGWWITSDYNHLFTSKHMACRETERVQPALSVGQSPYYMRKSVGQAPTAERAQQKRVGRLPTSERNENHNVGRGPT